MKPCLVPIFAALALGGCKPPATDEYIGRGKASEHPASPSTPLVSPDSRDAFWAGSQNDNRIIYGKTGAAPYMALSCAKTSAQATVHVTRFAAADAEAKALMALIGNGHIVRLPIEAVFDGKVWLWEGRFRATNPDLDVFTGPRQVELTIPGAGSIILSPSPRPAQLIDRCRQLAAMPLPPS